MATLPSIAARSPRSVGRGRGPPPDPSLATELSAHLSPVSDRHSDFDAGWHGLDDTLLTQESEQYMKFTEHARIDGVSNVSLAYLLGRVTSSAVSLSLGTALEFSLLLISFGYAGRYSDHAGIQYFTGASLAVCWMMMTLAGCTALVHGVYDEVVEAMTTGRTRRVAAVVQSALAISFFSALLLVPLWLLSDVFLGWCGQDAEPGRLAADFLSVALIGVLQLLSYRVIVQFLKARHTDGPVIIINGLVAVAHYFLSTILVDGAGTFAGWGFQGIPAALAISWTLLLLFGLGYLAVAGVLPEITEGGSLQAFRPSAMAEVVRTGKSLGVLEMVEMIVFYAPVLLAGLLPHNTHHYIAAQGLLTVGYTFLWLLFQGWGLSAQRFVRQAVREGEAVEAKNMVISATLLSTVFAVIACALVYGLKDDIVRGFTTDAGVTFIATASLKIAAFALFVDIVAFTVRGVLRGIERKGRGGAVYTLASVFIGLPAYGVLAFALGEQVAGFWEARVSLMLVVVIVVALLLLRVNWTHEAGRAQKHNFAPVATRDPEESSSEVGGAAFVRL